jgi:hypothetical protein
MFVQDVVMRKNMLRWMMGVVVCGGIASGGAVVWAYRLSSFRWLLNLGDGYALVIQYGTGYDGPFYRACSLPAPSCASFPPGQRSVIVSYRTTLRMYPLVTIPLRDE